MGEVVESGIVTRLDTDPARVIRSALDAGLTEVVMVGLDADGDFYFASSLADGAQAAWHLDRAKWKLMQIVDEMEQG